MAVLPSAWSEWQIKTRQNTDKSYLSTVRERDKETHNTRIHTVTLCLHFPTSAGFTINLWCLSASYNIFFTHEILIWQFNKIKTFKRTQTVLSPHCFGKCKNFIHGEMYWVLQQNTMTSMSHEAFQWETSSHWAWHLAALLLQQWSMLTPSLTVFFSIAMTAEADGYHFDLVF